MDAIASPLERHGRETCPMLGYNITGLAPRCVLPFAAGGAQLQNLREAVRVHLAQWCVPALVDEAQLVVTELAANVIKHVGEGAAATLIMELNEDRLRIELHDTSSTLPVIADAGCDSECGRGLYLVAAMAADCAASLTAVGKVVWCELSLVPGHDRTRSRRAAAVLRCYCDEAGVRAPASAARVVSLPLVEEIASALISDLLYWLAMRGGSVDDVLSRAQAPCEAEVKSTA